MLCWTVEWHGQVQKENLKNGRTKGQRNEGWEGMSKRAMPNTQQLPLAVWRTLDCELSLHKSYLNEILIFHNVRSSACHLAIKKDEHLGIKQRSTTLTRCLPLEVPHIHMLGQRCLHFSEEEERKRERENNLDLLQEKKRKKKKVRIKWRLTITAPYNRMQISLHGLH